MATGIQTENCSFWACLAGGKAEAPSWAWCLLPWEGPQQPTWLQGQ